MINRIFNLVGEKGALFCEGEFLGYLRDKIPESSRQKIIESSTELELVNSLKEEVKPEELIASLRSLKFPETNVGNILIVLGNTIFAEKDVFDKYQRLYLSSLLIKLSEGDRGYLYYSVEAITSLLESFVFSKSNDNEFLSHCKKFFYNVASFSMDNWEVNERTYCALFAVHLILLMEERPDLDEELLIFNFIFFQKRNLSHYVEENWLDFDEKVINRWYKLYKGVRFNKEFFDENPLPCVFKGSTEQHP